MSPGFALLALLLLPAAAAAAAPPPGAAACSGCHRPAGGAVPPLVGRPAAEIVEAMRAYRAGERAPTVMDRIAKGFSEVEVQAIADWLAVRG